MKSRNHQVAGVRSLFIFPGDQTSTASDSNDWSRCIPFSSFGVNLFHGYFVVNSRMSHKGLTGPWGLE